MEFSRPEYWSGEPFPSPGDLPNPGIEPRSPTLQADSLPAEPQISHQGSPKSFSLLPFYKRGDLLDTSVTQMETFHAEVHSSGNGIAE